MEVTPLICTSGSRMHAGVVPYKNYRGNHLLLAGVIQHAFEFLPIGTIEPRVVKARISDIVRPSGYPRVDKARISEIVRPSGYPWIEIGAESVTRPDRF